MRGEASCSENSDNNPGTIPSGPSRRQQETTTNSTVQNYTAVECQVPHVAILEGKVIFKWMITLCSWPFYEYGLGVMAKAHDLKLSVCTLNVRGLRESQKRQTVFHWLKQQNTDLICLQETYCTRNIVTKFDKEWNGKKFHCLSTSSHKCGALMLTK